MTTTQFHNALLQGRGSCILAVREDPEAYRSEILWACRELTSFDTQCEGSKAWFIRELVRCYDDPTPFVGAACDALMSCPSDGSWHVFCLMELLEWFYRDGHTAAWEALLRKYRQLYHEMLHIGPPEDCCYWAARDDYERLCVILSWCQTHFLEIAHDIGRLSLETEWLKEWEFDWLYHKGRRYLRSLTKAAEKDPCLAEYLRVHETAYQEFQSQRTNRPRKRLPWKCADPERLNAAMDRYLTAETPEDRAKALDAFHWTAYPGDPAPILADAQSDNERLRNAAWLTLAQIRHPAVRKFALANLDTEEDAFPIFVTNYEKRDEERLMGHLRSQTVDFACTTWWHRDQLDVLRMDERRPLAPRAALQFIFDTTYCSCCRYDALQQMGRRRMLTDELLEECRFDSNDEIRSYARRALRRRAEK